MHLDPRCSQRCDGARRPGSRAESVDQHPTGHAAGNGASQCGYDFLAGLVVGKDVIQKVHMRAAAVDVLRQQIDRCIVIRQEFGVIAAQAREASQILDQGGGLFQICREVRLLLLGHLRQPLVYGLEHDR